MFDPIVKPLVPVSTCPASTVIPLCRLITPVPAAFNSTSPEPVVLIDKFWLASAVTVIVPDHLQELFVR